MLCIKNIKVSGKMLEQIDKMRIGGKVFLFMMACAIFDYNPLPAISQAAHQWVA